jgi:hypothetical protein
VNQRKRKADRAARKKEALTGAETMSEPMPPESLPTTSAPYPHELPPPGSNGDEDNAFARLADDGSPVPPQSQTEEAPALAASEAEPPVAAPTTAVAFDRDNLEQRIRRLEDAITLLLEQRNASVRSNVPASNVALTEPPTPAPVVAPPAAPPVASSATMLLDVSKRLWATAAPQFPTATIPTAPAARPSFRGSLLWLFWDTWAEARAIGRMFVDPRYHLPWSARLLLMGLLAAILTSKYWVPGSSIPILGDWLLIKFVDLLLAFVLFKWLGHEARRYRQTSPDLPANLRL